MLYTRDKSGKPRYWKGEVITDREKFFISKKFGQVGGKETETRTEITTGKNIGKKNETTPLEQAHLELKSLIKKQMDAGYVQSLDDLETRVLILPMLANNWEKMSHYIQEPFYIQPKLDGGRMLVGKHQGKLLMLSRTGKPVKYMDHIAKELEWLPEGRFLDGESYNHDITFEEITGMCRTSLESSASEKPLEQIQFHVFDTFDINNLNETFEQRHKYIVNTIFKKKMYHTMKVPTVNVESRDNVYEWHKEFKKAGYEGVMIRDLRGKYLLADRSNHLLKLKSFDTAEYKIVDAEAARGRDTGTVVWVCETRSGQRFSVRPRGTVDQRRNWLATKDLHIGKMLTVQYQNLTPDGLPRFPVGLTFRDYE